MRILSLSLALIMPLTALAADSAAPATPSSGPQLVATLTRVSGLVRVARGGNEKLLAPGVAGVGLNAGDTVVVLSGRAEIQFTSGNVIRLNKDTTLRVEPPEEPGARKRTLGRTFAMLVRGSIKALVRHVNPDEGFAVESQSAIASVKGTVFFFDGLTLKVKDEQDAGTHQVVLADARSERTILIGEGMEGGINGDGSFRDPHPFDPGQLQHEEQELEGDLNGGATGGGGQGGSDHGGQGGGQGNLGNTSSQGTQGTEGEGDDDSQEFHDELVREASDFQSADDLADLTDHLERQGDQSLVAVALDRHGYRVRVDESIHLVAPDQIQILVLSTRDGGPDAGLTYMQNDYFFNTRLPADSFDSVRRHYLQAFSDPTITPPYWTTKEEQKFVNPAGDAVLTRVLLDEPKLVYDYVHADGDGGTWAYTPYSILGNYHFQGPDGWDASPRGWAQPYELARYVQFGGGDLVPKEHFLFTEYGNVAAGWYAGASPAAEYPTDAEPSGGCYYSPGIPTLWAANGPNVVTGVPLAGPGTQVARDPDGHPMYRYDFNFLDGFGGYYGGSPDFNNPFLGSGSTGAFFDEDGGITERTVYGDGTSLSESYYFVSSEGEVQSLFGDFSATKINLEREISFDGGPDGALHGIDLLIDPDLFQESDPSPNLYQSPPDQEPGPGGC